jgi:hypothetical protein
VEVVFGFSTIALATLIAAAPVQSVSFFTGTWAGPLNVNVDGKTSEEHVHVVLRQAGEIIIGTAGESADQQYPIRNARLTTVKDVTTLTFEYIANGVHSSFSLRPLDGNLRGDVRIVGEDGHTYTATAELKPIK